MGGECLRLCDASISQESLSRSASALCSLLAADNNRVGTLATLQLCRASVASVECSVATPGSVLFILPTNTVTASHCTVGQSPKGMMVFIYIGHYQGCRVLKCVQGCCRVCPGVLQNVCRDTECVQGAVLTSSLAHQD